MPAEARGTPQSLLLGTEEDGGVKKKDYRQICKYGKECYQKNPMHHQKFRHPKDGDDKIEDQAEQQQPANDDVDPEEEEDEEEVKEVATPPAKKAKLDNDDDDDDDEVVDGVGHSKTSVVEVTPFDEAEQTEAVEDNSEQVPDFADWPKDPVKSVEQKFLTKMPEDFMAFWTFCKGMKWDNPREALLDTCGLLLVGPYDIVAGQEFASTKLNDYLCHSRYYRDPPEFQTILASTDKESNFHVGYYRDDPSEIPVFMGAIGGKKGTPEYDNCKFVMMGDNIFAALYLQIAQLVAKANPFKMTAMQKLKESIHFHATMKNQDLSFRLEAKSTAMKFRDKKKVTPTFHGAGLVVPYNKETQLGYREIPETTANLKKIFARVVDAHKDGDEESKNKALDVLQELITNVQFANDEGDPGMGLELGLDALLHGGDCLNSTARHLLSVAYGLLNRDAFAKIANAHMNRRKEGVACFKAQ